MSNQRISINLVKSYGIGASIISIIQSIVWFVFCFLGILYYLGVIKYEFEEYELIYYLYYLFFNENNDNVGVNVIINSPDFMIIMAYYLVISLCWFAISVYFCIVVFMNKWHQSKYSIIPWTIITGIIVISDTIVVGLLGADLSEVSELYNPSVDISYYLMIFLSGRGFVFWAINLIYVILFTNIIIKDYVNKQIDVINPDRETNHIQAFNETNFDREDQISNAFEHNDLESEEESRRPSFSDEFFNKLENNYKNMPNLPRVPYISHKELRPITPPIDYSPITDRRHMQYRREYEPLKY